MVVSCLGWRPMWRLGPAVPTSNPDTTLDNPTTPFSPRGLLVFPPSSVSLFLSGFYINQKC